MPRMSLNSLKNINDPKIASAEFTEDVIERVLKEMNCQELMCLTLYGVDII